MHSKNQKKMDSWFERENGDPWGYDHSKSIHTRLKKTLSIVKKYFPENFNGCFAEFGCFNGSFTEMLSINFPKAQISAYDVSTIALEKAKINLGSRSNVRLFWLDLESIENHLGVLDRNSDGVFLLECLYYLDRGKRGDVLNKCKEIFPGAIFFCSVPITGANYFSEEEFIALVKNGGGKIIDIKTVSLKSGNGFIQHIQYGIMEAIKLLRSHLANQVCFVFRY